MSINEQLAKNFLAKLQEIRANGKAPSFEDIQAVLGDLTESTAKELYDEIAYISNRINAARSNISSLESEKIAADFIPDANMELEAVVKATEDATHKILDATEAIQNTLEGVDDATKSAVNEHAGKIFEACNFQDITGQRISKVVSALVEIEKSINDFLDGKPVSKQKKDDGDATAASDEELMRGPQLEQPTQEDIDKLFAELD